MHLIYSELVWPWNKRELHASIEGSMLLPLVLIKVVRMWGQWGEAWHWIHIDILGLGKLEMALNWRVLLFIDCLIWFISIIKNAPKQEKKVIGPLYVPFYCYVLLVSEMNNQIKSNVQYLLGDLYITWSYFSNYTNWLALIKMWFASPPWICPAVVLLNDDFLG